MKYCKKCTQPLGPKVWNNKTQAYEDNPAVTPVTREYKRAKGWNDPNSESFNPYAGQWQPEITYQHQCDMVVVADNCVVDLEDPRKMIVESREYLHPQLRYINAKGIGRREDLWASTKQRRVRVTRESVLQREDDGLN